MRYLRDNQINALIQNDWKSYGVEEPNGAKILDFKFGLISEWAWLKFKYHDILLYTYGVLWPELGMLKNTTDLFKLDLIN